MGAVWKLSALDVEEEGMRVLVRLTGDVCAQLAQAELAEKGWHEHQGMHG